MTAGEKKVSTANCYQSFDNEMLNCAMFFEFTVLMTLGKKHVCTMYNIEMGLIIQGLKLDFVYIEMTLRQG